MSYYLWRYFLEDDVESFRSFLGQASFAPGAHSQRGFPIPSTPLKNGSPGTHLSTSPKLTSKNRRSGWGGSATGAAQGRSDGQYTTLSRGELNRRDHFGRTLLHHAASSSKPSAGAFVSSLLEVPFLDLYVQDLESGWTALHRALYCGNITTAHALMARDIRDATDYTMVGAHHYAGGLIKIKDHEGNSPFDVYGATIASRRLAHSSQLLKLDAEDVDGSSYPGSANGDADSSENVHNRGFKNSYNLEGDEVFTFGSNKNLNLGLGDEDDRQYPERITLQRPDHLLQRFHMEWMSDPARQRPSDKQWILQQNLMSEGTPSFLAIHPNLTVQDLAMSKLHTAVITNDPESNLFICGFGPGGRLGTGDEATRFSFVCIDPPCLSGKRIARIALGQDHTIAISDEGEVFSWGSNKYGQLGYNLPKTNPKTENIMQLSPRQIFGPLKKETVLGAAASAIHSVVFTSTSLYTFGQNEGQLGLVDSDARSLEIQVAPRKVAASLFSSPIAMVSAIDRATVCLLESHDVWVFTHYGYAKLMFPLDGFTNYFLQTSTLPTRYDSAVNYISKISSGGNTICAMSSFGEVYTAQVSHAPEPDSSSTSTTNPGKIRNSLPQPSRVWSVGKPHMAVKDVDVGQDGSIIICTEAGSVWRKEKRAKIKQNAVKGTIGSRLKDYKFVRIPSLTKAIAVRSNTFGAYAAVRKDCDVTRTQILVESQNLWQSSLELLPFRDLKPMSGDSHRAAFHPGHVSRAFDSSPALIKQAVLTSSDIEVDLKDVLGRRDLSEESDYNIWIKTSTSNTRIPVHEFVLSSRSILIRNAMQDFRQNYYFELPETLCIEYDKEGQVQVQFMNVDFMVVLNLVFYIYTDNIVDSRFHTGRSSRHVAKHKQVRSELMKVAASLEMRSLEMAARMMIDPSRTLHMDMETAISEPRFFDSGDVVVELLDSDIKVHSSIMANRCPFFEGLFNGRAGGQWLSARKDARQEPTDLIKVDLKHIEPQIFKLVLRHIYADTGDDLFDDILASTLDDFLDIVIEVMSVANELMLDRLAQVCQKLLGRFVTTRNVSQLLNAVAPCSVMEFKNVAFEYICLNLEAMLENRLLDDLDKDLMLELDEVIQSNQREYLQVSRSGDLDTELISRHPELLVLLEQSRQRRVDSMALRSRLDQDEERFESTSRPKYGSLERGSSFLSTPRPDHRSPKPDETVSTTPSPLLRPKELTSDLIFDMDDEQTRQTPSKSRRYSTSSTIDEEESMQPRRLASMSSLGAISAQSPETLPKDIAVSHRVDLGADPQGLQISLPQAGAVPALSNATSSGTPWDSSNFRNTKVDMREILAQTSSSRTSNLSLGMAASKEKGSIGNFTSKLSQKERKKLQQQHQEEAKASTPDQRPHAAGRAVSEKTPASPWQIAQKQRTANTDKSPSTNMSNTDRAPSRTPLTMRQTIPGNASSPKTPNSTPQRQTSLLSASSPATPVHPHPKQPSRPSLGPQTPSIHSIRHTPLPKTSISPSSSRGLSMADILAQQQSEKDIIREAATAKRSLQDIQQEQEFQEWWDQESAKVRAEQEAVDAITAKGGGSSRGRGKGRGRGRGRGGTGAGQGLTGERERERDTERGRERRRGDLTGGGGRGRRGQEHHD